MPYRSAAIHLMFTDHRVVSAALVGYSNQSRARGLSPGRHDSDV